MVLESVSRYKEIVFPYYCSRKPKDGVAEPVRPSALFTGPEDSGMGTKFSEDVNPLTGLKLNPGHVIKRATDAHRPVLWRSERVLD